MKRRDYKYIVSEANTAKPMLAELKGKRLIISSEMEEGMRLNTAVVKQLCSTDEIQAEKKYIYMQDSIIL